MISSGSLWASFIKKTPTAIESLEKTSDNIKNISDTINSLTNSSD